MDRREQDGYSIVGDYRGFFVPSAHVVMESGKGHDLSWLYRYNSARVGLFILRGDFIMNVVIR